MKIEDIKPGDVIVHTEGKILFKVTEVTPEGEIMQSANGRLNEVFCIFQEPHPMAFCSVDEFEPSTEEQRQYMDSKLAIFNGAKPEAESNKRITALASMMGDLKQENNALTERVRKLTDDNTRMAKRIDSSRSLSDLTEALDKVEALERDCDFFRKEYDHSQRLYESLFNQHDIQRKELNVVREERDDAKEQYNELQQKYEELRQQYDTAKDALQKPSDELRKAYEDYLALRDLNDTANKRIARFENADIEHADFSTMALDCPHGVEAKVCSAECLGCEHCLTHGNTGTRSILCAYNYDKKKEKEEELDTFRGKLNRELNS